MLCPLLATVLRFSTANVDDDDDNHNNDDDGEENDATTTAAALTSTGTEAQSRHASRESPVAILDSRVCGQAKC